MRNPLVSIIVPCCNVENYIEETILSVLNQTYKEIELILVNDGSTDKTMEKIKSFSYDKRVKYISQNNRGVSSARNLGLSISKGKYICFLDGDDLYLDEKISKQIKKMELNHSNVCYCRTKVTKLNNIDDIRKVNLYKKEGKILEDFILQKAYITTNDWMISKSFLVNNNLVFDEKYKYGEDFNFFMKVLSLSYAVCVDEVLTIYRVNDKSSSYKVKIRDNKEDNYITEYIKWINSKENLIYSYEELKSIHSALTQFLMPLLFVKNICFKEKVKLSKYEKEILNKFKFNLKNIKTSIKYYYLYIKVYIKNYFYEYRREI